MLPLLSGHPLTGTPLSSRQYAGRAPFQSVAGRYSAACTFLVGYRFEDARAAYGLHVARVSRSLGSRFAPAVFKYHFAVRCPFRVGAHRGGPRPAKVGFRRPRPLKASARPSRPLWGVRASRANRGLQPRGLHYVPPGDMHRARVGLPILSARRGAVALAADSLGNLPPRSIVLGAAYGLAARRRYAPPLKIQNKC